MSNHSLRYALALVACVAAGAAAGLAFAPAVRTTPIRAATSHEPIADGHDLELDRMRKQMQALQKQHSALEQRVSEVSVARPEANADPAEPEHEDPYAGLSDEERHEASMADQQAVFEEQPRDVVWQASREALIHERLAQPHWTQRGYQLKSAECRATMCRIELKAPPNAPMDIGSMLFEAPFEGQVRYFFADDGSVVTYAGRDDQPLPTLAQVAP